MNVQHVIVEPGDVHAALRRVQGGEDLGEGLDRVTQHPAVEA